MYTYLAALNKVLNTGMTREDRTGTGTLSLFGEQMRFNLRRGFPILTTKKVHFKSVLHELLWFLRGDVNISYLTAHGVTIWDEWADKDGEIGPSYGHQWRYWGWGGASLGIDQIKNVIREIKENPNSRRLVVTAWNPTDVPKTKLPPCHMFFQFYVHSGALSCHVYMRSADIFLGVPFNIASYALLTHMIAQVTRLEVGELVISYGDLHLYLNHVEQAKLQLTRNPRTRPKLELDTFVTDIDDFLHNNIRLIGYEAEDAIKAPVAV